MGKGDKRSKRGKIWSSSYGNSRPKTKAYKSGDAKPAKPANEAPTPVVDPTPPTE